MPMEKLKPLIPTLREKKRYVSFEIISKDDACFEYPEVTRAIRESYKALYGETGEAKAGLLVIPKKYKDNKGVIRVNNKSKDKLLLSLAMIKEINKKEVIIRSLITSGMISKAEQRLTLKKN